MKTGLLLYDERDYAVNRMFAAHICEKAKMLGIDIQVTLTENLSFPLQSLPDFVVSRQRNHLLSAEFEKLGIPVFNNARVCELCNDKRNTHRFLQGLPLMKTEFPAPGSAYFPEKMDFPLVVKPASGHGGDRVALALNQRQLEAAISQISPYPALVQATASEAGKDLRIYVLFGSIVAAVMRSAQSGIVSNYKRGGNVQLHTLTAAETGLAQKVIDRFSGRGAPLSFAGIDMIFHNGTPVINEVEDVVGSRMLYKVSDIDIIDMYIRQIAGRLC